MNRVMLVGRITRDPELRRSPNGVAFTTFTIAVNRQLPNAQGERVADFINCVAFNKQADEQKRFEAVSDDYTKTSIKVAKISALLEPSIFLIVDIATIALLAVAAIALLVLLIYELYYLFA